MTLYKKLFSLVLCLSTCVSIPLFASTNAIDFDVLEKRHPIHFRGFSKIDFSSIKRSSIPEHLFIFDKNNFNNLTLLQQKLLGINTPESVLVAKNIQSDLNNKKLGGYVSYCLEAVLSVSKKTKDEEQFFTTVGFPDSYDLINHKNKGQLLFVVLEKIMNGHPDRQNVDIHITHRIFNDLNKQFSKIFKTSAFKPTLYFMLCAEPEEDILGLFYLAYTYAQGIHTIPVSLQSDDKKLHGIKMSPWGKICHDFAHSESDFGKYNVKQFANNIGNHYLTVLKAQLITLNSDQKKDFGIDKIIPHIYQFSISVSDAYRTSLLQILEQSMRVLNTSTSDLSPEFEAFSAAAFLHAHEIPVDLSRRFATSQLNNILSSSVQSIIFFTKDNDKEKDLFQTSYITGETSLSDTEIFETVKKRPAQEYLSAKTYLFSAADIIQEDEIADFSVCRNTHYIEVKITMIDGSEHVYQSATNYSKTLNLEHDRQILWPARSVLESKYKYTIPEVPQIRQNDIQTDANFIKKFGGSIIECQEQLSLGQRHLLDYFLETCQMLSKHNGENNITISNGFTQAYTQALNELQRNLPSFVGDIQTFLSQAMKKP